MAAGSFGEEKTINHQVVSFSMLFWMFTLTCITEKELERVIENKGDEFFSYKLELSILLS